jgi:hypothetical protein
MYGMNGMPELQPTIVNQMAGIKEKLDKHKKRKSVKESLGNMQNSVDKLLFKAANLGLRLNPKQDKKSPEDMIQILRRGWSSKTDREKKNNRLLPEVAADETGVTQINQNSPEINAV